MAAGTPLAPDKGVNLGHLPPQKAALPCRGWTTTAFDNLNRLTSIANVGVSSGNYLASSHAYTYNTANERTGAQLKDGATWAYGYDALGQVISAKKKFSDGTFVPGEQFEFVEDEWASQSPPQVCFPGRVVRFANRGGNRTSAKSGGDSTGSSSALRSFTYTPNTLNQYTSRTVPNTVDVIGVANSSASVTVNSQAAYRKGEFYQKSITAANGGNQAVTVTATSGSSVTKTGNIFVPPASEAFTYDLDGNLTSDGRWNYVWDAENRLIRLTGKISGVQPTQVDYEYDWRGRRIKKVVTGTTTTTAKYLYDGWNLVAELDGNNALVRSYMWGLDLSGSTQGAGGVGGLLYTKPASGSAQFCAYDGNGNVMALVDGGNGGLTAEYEYGAFGETLRANGASASLNPFRFSTKFTDDESDLVYYGYRYLVPSAGRWLSRDPIGERGGVNLYWMVGNNSVTRLDFQGLVDAGDVIPGWWDAIWNGFDWAFGHDGITEYGPDSLQSRQMSQSAIADQLRSYFLKKNKGKLCKDWQGVSNFKTKFRVFHEVIVDGFNGTAEFVGDARGDVIAKKDLVECKILAEFHFVNTTSLRSLLYGVWPDRWNVTLPGFPFANWTQYYTWNESFYCDCCRR